MAIGSLWLPQEKRAHLNKEIRATLAKNSIGSEAKWSKISYKKLEAYKALLDIFLENKFVLFRAIIVDVSKLDHDRFNHGDKELGFYKFYFQLLKAWIRDNHEYTILLDRQTSSDASRLPTLKKVLVNDCHGKASIKELTAVDSNLAPCSQLCDVLTGATCSAFNRDHKGDSKGEFISYAEKSLGRPMRARNMSKSFCKYNTFKINLQ